MVVLVVNERIARGIEDEEDPVKDEDEDNAAT